jgi:hypothetical protein
MNSMVLHGSNQDVEAMAIRFKTALKGGDKLNNNEARALAQVSLVTGLNPYIGEVWYIPGKGPMVGIAGARHLWNEKSRAGGGYSFVEILPCAPDEAGAVEADVVGAFKAIAHDSKATTEYQKLFSQTLETLRAAGTDPKVLFEEARMICGPKPQWVGYGYATKSEPSVMNKMKLARKRAEADALKKCVVIPFGANVSVNDVSPHYDVEAQVEDVTEHKPMTIEEARQTIITTRANGEKFLGELNAEQLQLVIENAKTASHIEAARLVLATDFQMESA